MVIKTKQLKLLRHLHNLKGKKVIVRSDFNVPIKNGRIIDNSRLQASLPTIEFLLKHQAKIILISHLGRPSGKIDPHLKLNPVAKELTKLLKRKVKKINFCHGEKVEIAVKKMKIKDILLLENIRFSKLEKDNRGFLAYELAQLGDLFVLDGFAVAHRKSASVAGIANFLPSYAGLLLEKEIKNLNKIFQYSGCKTALLGGAKVKTKLPLIKSFLKSFDYILVGGVIFNTYLKSLDYQIGSSKYESELLVKTRNILRNKKVIKPIDVVVYNPQTKKYWVVNFNDINKRVCCGPEMILDIGPQTIIDFSNYLRLGQVILWNGALGYFEKKPFYHGTYALSRLIAGLAKSNKIYGLAGGGETLQVIKDLNLTMDFDFLSTGGGAMLNYLAGLELPGLKKIINY